MPYVSAKYMPSDALSLPDAPRQIQAIDEQGQVWALREDSQVGDWLRYIAEGGTVDPVDTEPEPEPAPIPDPAPLPADPNRAQPDVLQDAPLSEE